MIWMLFRAKDNLDVDVFTVHEPPGRPLDRIDHAASLAFVRDGFSWGAALFSPFWLAVKGQWAALVAYLTVVLAASGVPNTYVPFRNANLLSIATSFAEARSADAIFIGVQSQDYSGYPDCRPRFIEAFQQLVDIGTRDETRITHHGPLP